MAEKPSEAQAPPNSCKKLTKRRLFARSPSGLLGQSTLDGRHAARNSVSRSAAGVPPAPSPWEAALQFMRQSLGGRQEYSRAMAEFSNSKGMAARVWRAPCWLTHWDS